MVSKSSDSPARVKLGSKDPAPVREASFWREQSAYLYRLERADERTRTADLLITSELLYQLSYVGLLRFVSIS